MPRLSIGRIVSLIAVFTALLAQSVHAEEKGVSDAALITAAQAVERASQRIPSAPSLKPRSQIAAAQAEQSGLLLSAGGTKFYDEQTRQWRPIEDLEGN